MSQQFDQLEEFLTQLSTANIYHRLNRVREGYVMVEVVVPGERWEVEFEVGGGVEVEIFRSDGRILGPEELPRLLREFGEAT